MVELIERQTLDARIAAFLWLALEQRASIVVAATPPAAGKTTMLTALLDFLPPRVEAIYLRGWYERFAFLDEVRPTSAYLLCNEISSHLPTYLWGRGVRRLFEAMRHGYGMGTTVHADGLRGVVDLLASYPLEVPFEWLCEIDFVLTLSVGKSSSGITRRLMRVEAVHNRGGQPEAEIVAERDVLLGPLTSRPGHLIGILCSRFAMTTEHATAELARRERVLNRLRQDGVLEATAVRDALRAYLADRR